MEKIAKKNLKRLSKKCLIFIKGDDYVSYKFLNDISVIKEQKPEMIAKTIADAKQKYPEFVLYNQL